MNALTPYNPSLASTDLSWLNILEKIRSSNLSQVNTKNILEEIIRCGENQDLLIKQCAQEIILSKEREEAHTKEKKAMAYTIQSYTNQIKDLNTSIHELIKTRERYKDMISSLVEQRRGLKLKIERGQLSNEENKREIEELKTKIVSLKEEEQRLSDLTTGLEEERIKLINKLAQAESEAELLKGRGIWLEQENGKLKDDLQKEMRRMEDLKNDTAFLKVEYDRFKQESQKGIFNRLTSIVANTFYKIMLDFPELEVSSYLEKEQIEEDGSPVLEIIVRKPAIESAYSLGNREKFDLYILPKYRARIIEELIKIQSDKWHKLKILKQLECLLVEELFSDTYIPYFVCKIGGAASLRSNNTLRECWQDVRLQKIHTCVVYKEYSIEEIDIRIFFPRFALTRLSDKWQKKGEREFKELAYISSEQIGDLLDKEDQ